MAVSGVDHIRAADLEALDADLIRLHGSGDAGALSQLHEHAAVTMDEPGARRFHLTHAWVFALESGDPARSALLEARLRASGGL